MPARKYAKKPQPDIYKEVTDAIVAKLEQGVAPWVRPWTAKGPGVPVNGKTGRKYSGINIPWLWMQADARGFTSSEWYTFKNASDLGARVIPGETCSRVIFFKTFSITEDVEKPDGTVEGKEKHIPMIKWPAIFNRDQIDGLPDPEPTELATLSSSEREQRAEDFLLESGATITHGGGRAFYRSSTDTITMPPFDTFHSGSEYYSTALHELTHWTGAPDRCARKFGNRFGDESYAAEELVAELGAAFLCAQLGIDGQLQHPEYIANWLRVLKDDKKAIFTASRYARESNEFLNGTTAAV